MPLSGDNGANDLSVDQSAYARIVAIGSLVLDWLRTFVNVIVIALLSAMICLILVQILGRYVFNFSIAWSEEAATFAQVWLVMLGAGVAMRRQQHAGIDMVIAMCSANVQRVAKTASMLLIIWFLFVVITGSIALIGIGLVLKSPALQLPMVVPYLALPVGMTYFLLELAIVTLPAIRHPTRAAKAPPRGVE